MILTPLPTPDLRVRADQYTERSSGLHLSHITQDILVGMDPEKYGDKDDSDQKWMNFIMGLIFERVLAMAWLDRERAVRPELIRPGEVTLDGVTGTPDAYDCLIGQPEEYKCTKKSSRQDIRDRKFWIYWVQLKAYAKMLGCTSGALWVLFINGNNSKNFDDPDASYQIKGWQANWTQLEIDENWMMLINHARRRGWL